MTSLAYFLTCTDDSRNQAQLDDVAKMPHIDYFFEDESLNASIKLLQRPQFIELYKSLRPGDTVVVCSIECLGVCAIDLIETLEALGEKGVRVFFAREAFVFAIPPGKLTLRQLGNILRSPDTAVGKISHRG